MGRIPEGSSGRLRDRPVNVSTAEGGMVPVLRVLRILIRSAYDLVLVKKYAHEKISRGSFCL